MVSQVSEDVVMELCAAGDYLLVPVRHLPS